MNTTMIVFIAIGGTIVFALGLTWVIRVLIKKMDQREHTKARRLEAEASARGWRYAEQDERYAPFLGAHVRTVRHVVTGQHRSHEFISASHRSTKPTSAETSTANPDSHAIGIRLPVALPALDVRRTTRLDGGGGPRFANPEFTGRFQVTTEHAAFAGELLTPTLQQWLVEASQAKGRGFTIAGEWMWLNTVTTVSGAAVNFEEVLAGLEFLCEVFDRIPSGVPRAG